MKHLLLIFASVFTFIITVFAVQNSTIVNVNMFYWNIETSLLFVILGAASLGFLISMALGLVIQLKLRFQLFKDEQRIKTLEKNL